MIATGTAGMRSSTDTGDAGCASSFMLGGICCIGKDHHHDVKRPRDHRDVKRC